MQAGAGFNEHRVSHQVLQKKNSQQQNQQHIINTETPQPRARSAMAKIRLQEGEIRYNTKGHILAGTSMAQSESQGQAKDRQTRDPRQTPPHVPYSQLQTQQLGENWAEQDRFGHLCILKEWRTHSARTTHSTLMDGWVYLGNKDIFGVPSGLPK